MQLSDVVMITGTTIIIALELLAFFLIILALFCVVFRGGDFTMLLDFVNNHLYHFRAKPA